jgi:regulator of sigma E protease
MSLGRAMKASVHEIREQAKLTFWLLWYLGRNIFSGDAEKVENSVNKLSWPVGIVKFGEQILEFWWWLQYLAFGGMVSLALAFFNMLPIPALDGGRALWVLIQHTFRLKPEKYYVIEWYFNFIVFVLMMLLGIYIILLDLVRFWWVNIPFIWS